MSQAMDLNTTPGMEPPYGHMPQFDVPYTKLQKGVVASFGVTFFFATVLLGLRYFQAFKLVKKVEVDLVIITVSFGVSILYFATTVNLMEYGWGKHLYDVSLADLMQFNKVLLPNTLAYLMCPSITKTAMLSVLFRINPSKLYRFVITAVAVAIILYTLALCSITGGPCSPLKDGTLVCLQNVALSHAVLNIASDVAVVIVPMPTVFGLNLSLKQKISVACILTLGSGVVICSIVRLPYVINLRNEPDVTYTQAILGIWSLVEVNLGIICACAMRLKHLITTYLPSLSLFSSFSKSRTAGESWGKGLRSDPDPRGQHSYQLQKRERGQNDSQPGGKDIHVELSYDVNIEQKRHGDASSTDEILIPEPSHRHH